MDGTDLKLLYILKNDARMSLTKIGGELSLSVPAVTYRLNRLVGEGVIRNFTINIDDEKLAPNYTSFLIESRVGKDCDTFIDELRKTMYIDSIIKIASHQNLVVITKNITSANLNNLISILDIYNIDNYEIKPIISKDYGDCDTDLVAENVSSIYCPLCQESLDGRGIITSIGSQIMGFCCESCKNEFLETYSKISLK
ncbi:MAG: putative HTH-type transcriptional regulator [Candidatus Heimdallarchaeota archaeon LC_2]|nr:MAG: putative HTH-type transcriptional regulator [Candidatus Heimdallarchaeota archaeon LC_2]